MSPDMPDDVELTAEESDALRRWAAELTDQERAVVDRFEAAPAAEESWEATVGRVADGMHMSYRDAAESLNAFTEAARRETLRRGVEKWIEDWGDDCGERALRRLRALLDQDDT